MKGSLIFFCLITMVFGGVSYSQDTKYITFTDKQIPFQSRHFYIHHVRDERIDSSTIGTINSDSLPERLLSVNFRGGLTNALSDYLAKNFRQDTTTVAIELQISKLEVSEKKEGFKAELKLRSSFSFSIAGKKIAEYNGGGSQQARLSAAKYTEELIRNNVEDVLLQFDNWFAKNHDEVMAEFRPPLVKVVIKNSSDDLDKIAWSADRPLTKDDFAGIVNKLSKASAESYVDILLNYSKKNTGGRLIFTVTLVPFFDKTRSWISKRNYNRRILDHEQLHFDIVAILACELAELIKVYPFTVENFEKEIQKLYKKNGQRMLQLNHDYDLETKHGLRDAEQVKWSDELKEKVKCLEKSPLK